MRRLIGRLICKWKGHKRGRRVECLDNGKVKVFECPRCERRTQYKA
jgi:hypothetical protein